MLDENYKTSINEFLEIYFNQEMITENEEALIELYEYPKDNPFSKCDVINASALVLYKRGNQDDCIQYYGILKLISNKNGCELIDNPYTKNNPLPVYTVRNKRGFGIWI